MMRLLPLIAFLSCTAALAGEHKYLIVDPGESETGRACERTLGELPGAPAVRRIDLADVRRAGDEQWSAVVWLRPEPTLYHDASLALWRRVNGDAKTGLVVIGQPHDDAGKAAMFEALKPRSGPQPGPHLSKHLEGAFWIWADKTHDHQHVHFRRKFELKEMPQRCWIQVAADNAATVYLNGTEMGRCESWRRPVSIDFKNRLQLGKNVIAVEATNEDGPAGLIASMTARSDSGELMLELHTDREWKQLEPAKPDTNWRGQNFDDANWRPAKQLGPLGGGYWEDKLLEDYGADAYDLHVPDEKNPHPCVRGITWTNPVVVLDALTPGEHCTPLLMAEQLAAAVACEGDGGRLVMLSAEPELTSPIKGGEFIGETSFATSIAFPRFVAQATQWTAGVRDGDIGVGLNIEGRPAPIVSVTFPSRRWVYGGGEKPQVEASLNWRNELGPPRGHFEADVISADGARVVKLGVANATQRESARWTIDLAGRGVGKYTIRATYVSEDPRRPANFQGDTELDIVPPAATDTRFPIAMQLTPLPHDGLPMAKSLSDDPAALHHMIDNLIGHGITTLHVPVELPEPLAREVESYAQSRGMTITLWWFSKPAEVFDRKKPPEVSLYSPKYAEQVRQRIAENMNELSPYPRLLNVFAFQDEPFHQGGERSFGYSDEEKREFKQRFGYDLPPDLAGARRDPKTFLDTLNFRSDYWPVGWRTTYAELRRANANIGWAQNHDSHNTFGGGAQQESVINIDDVFHWGGDFADIYSFDIYPYLMLDFRYGPNRKLKLPRMSQTHYAFAQMRNLTYSFGKGLGFWVGTYNPEWYSLPPEGLEQYWMEREMAYTAVANGADYLLGGIGVPVDQRHWDDFGDCVNVLHKVGPQLLKTKKVRATAAMLFPRTQMLQTQEEYWNVAQSFEAFQRAFGELDVIHEEQVAAGKLDDYKMLVMWDVKLLAANVAAKIAEFADRGGVVIADCVPNQDELTRPTPAMEKLFGVSDAKTDRILWKIVKKKDDPESDYEESLKPKSFPTVRMNGDALGGHFDVPLVSARPCKVTDAEVLLKCADGTPGLMRRSVGKGRAYLMGFCLQDTAYQAWQNKDWPTVDGLNQLLAAVASDSGVRSRVTCSNGDVEAAVRANDHEAFVFVIAHEPRKPEATVTVTVRDLRFEPKRVIDVASGQELDATDSHGVTTIRVVAPTGTTKLLRLLP